MGLEGNISGGAEEGDSTGATMAKETTRIFVGGLGATVTADDIRKTFASLGDLESIDIVRSKGRSFAHIDFVPSSDKSLSKLFSTYNGCAWKGGKLKLEKAKEHYLLRLKREWADDVKLEKKAPINVVETAKELVAPGKSAKLLNSENIQLRFFFPKMGKVKPIPFGGSGKHKYSFQRVEVPPLPNHFCDCEEHYNPCNNIKGKHFHDSETRSGGVNEEELSMMQSVMNKLFEKKNVSKPGNVRVEPDMVEDNSAKSTDELLVNDDNVDMLEDNSTQSIDDDHVSDDDDHVSDDDNLVMNLVAGDNDIMLLRESLLPKTITPKEKRLSGETQAASVHKSTHMSKSRENEIVAPNKKRKLPSTDNGEGNELVSAIPERKRKLETSDIEQSITNKPSWSQKSAWKNLVGVGGNKSFRVTDIAPISAATGGEKPESVDLSVNEENNIEESPESDDDPIVHSSEESEEYTIEESPESDDDPSVHSSEESEEYTTENHENLDVIPEKSDIQPTKTNEVAKNSGRGASWLQKSSWTQLVGEKTNNSFSITQIVPGIAFKKHGDIEAPNSSSVTEVGSKALEVDNDRNISAKVTLAKKKRDHRVDQEKNKHIFGEKKDILAPTLAREEKKAENQSEPSPFMRNSASLKEWAKAKAALSRPAKKKGEEK